MYLLECTWWVFIGKKYHTSQATRATVSRLCSTNFTSIGIVSLIEGFMVPHIWLYTLSFTIWSVDKGPWCTALPQMCFFSPRHLYEVWVLISIVKSYWALTQLKIVKTHILSQLTWERIIFPSLSCHRLRIIFHWLKVSSPKP
jgi:hypothetical protein